MLQTIRRIFAVFTMSFLVRALFGAAVMVNCFVADPVSGTQSVRSFQPTEAKFRLDPLSASPMVLHIATQPDDRAPDFFSETAKLTASDAAAFDQLGFSVGVSGDYAIAGADRGNAYKGAAYIFKRNGSLWSQQQKLTGSDSAAEDSFGWSVAISGDTAVVGAYLDDNSGTDHGSVYVFTRNGTVWSEQQKLTAPDAAAGDQFGVSLSISGDTLIVGSFGNDASAARPMSS